MFPIKDQNPTRTFPFVNYLLIAANIAAYAGETWLISQQGEAAVVSGYGLVATRLLTDPLGEAFTIFSSMFMHGGLAHLGGNLLFLYIFGDNVEDSLGHGRYIAFYALTGIGAAAAQIATGVNSPVAMVGASGAISGVLGAYLLLHPRAAVVVLIPIGPFAHLTRAPAALVLGLWFALQLVSELLAPAAAGVAFRAHLGGFVAGLALLPLLRRRRRLR